MGGKPRSWPRDPFRLLVADPPWKMRDLGSRMAPSYSGNGRAYKHYPILDADQICSYGLWVRNLMAADSFLALWAPNALVLDGTATRVARAWGFEPKQLVPWLKTDAAGKPRLGGGHYTRVCTEQLVLCRRGRAHVLRRDVPGVIIAPRQAHSAKPDASYEMLEKLCQGPYLEMFARRRYSPAWTVWGNEVSGPLDTML